MANVRGSGAKNRGKLKTKTDEPKKYLTKGRGSRVLNPKWIAWNKAKTDKEDLAARKKENEKEQQKYIREEKPDGTVTVRKRTGVDSLPEIQKYTQKTKTGYQSSAGKSDIDKYSNNKSGSYTYDDVPESTKKNALAIRKPKNGNGSSSSKSNSKSKKEEIMISGKRASPIQKKLIAGGWTVKELEQKQRDHQAWRKKMGRA